MKYLLASVITATLISIFVMIWGNSELGFKLFLSFALTGIALAAIDDYFLP